MQKESRPARHRHFKHVPYPITLQISISGLRTDKWLHLYLYRISDTKHIFRSSDQCQYYFYHQGSGTFHAVTLANKWALQCLSLIVGYVLESSLVPSLKCLYLKAQISARLIFSLQLSLQESVPPPSFHFLFYLINPITEFPILAFSWIFSPRFIIASETTYQKLNSSAFPRESLPYVFQFSSLNGTTIVKSSYFSFMLQFAFSLSWMIINIPFSSLAQSSTIYQSVSEQDARKFAMARTKLPRHKQKQKQKLYAFVKLETYMFYKK